ncbi:hypothetical protein BOSEA31B_10357 [Hyphomicrobiales bacterium]|nr:hypothetical protein BOSEA31B_10357 [Hyphomicrobiales bacterium]CAH1702038.1 hypothetical protein BOSEA1005_21737 [Hyphomicrobiales bacterium]CAI0346195.1 hypothetical protein BO1005MUT1_490007 [Hyphomicrobiales bacterium]
MQIACVAAFFVLSIPDHRLRNPLAQMRVTPAAALSERSDSPTILAKSVNSEAIHGNGELRNL